MAPVTRSDTQPTPVPGWTSAPTPPQGSALPPPPDPTPRATSHLPPPPDASPWAGSHLPPPPPSWRTGPPPPPAPERPSLSLQHLLLGLGTALVAVATVVFTAVNWDRMGASVQALVLVGATAAAAVGAAAARRRTLPATAEALGTVAVLLAVADAHAFRVGLFPSVSSWGYWAGALAVVSLTAWAFGTAADLRSPRVIAAVLGQLPLVLALGAAQAGPTVGELAVLAQTAVVVLLVTRRDLAVPAVRPAAGWVATGLASLTVPAAAVDAVFSDGLDRLGPAAVLGAGAALAGLLAWATARNDGMRLAALAGATGMGLASGTTALLSVVPAEHGLAVLGLLAAVVVAVGVRVPARWGRTPAAVAGAVAGVASAPLLLAVSHALSGAAAVMGQAWELAAGDRASALVPVGSDLIDGTTIGLHLAGVVALLAAGSVALGAARTRALAVAAVLLAVVVAPLAVPMSVAAAGGAALAVAAALVVLFVLGALRAELQMGEAVAAATAWCLAAAWAAATPSLTLGTIAVGGVLAFVVLSVARATDEMSLAAGAASMTVGLAAALAGLAQLAGGSGSGAGWATAAAAAAAAALVLTVLVGGRAVDRAASVAAELSWWSIHGLALLAVIGLPDLGATRAVLAVGALAFALVAVRPGRQALWWVAGAHAQVLVWLQLGEWEVGAPEAYSLPLALVLLIAGLAAERRQRASGQTPASWVTLGPALVVAAAPSVTLAYAEPGLVRPLVALAVATVVLAVGALHGRRAPVDVGTAVVVLIGLRQLAPVVGELPNWATIGASGAVLLAVGATFEQRRRDVHEVHDRYRSLT